MKWRSEVRCRYISEFLLVSLFLFFFDPFRATFFHFIACVFEVQLHLCVMIDTGEILKWLKIK